MSATLSDRTTVSDICGELSETKGDLTRAQNALTSDYPTFDELDTALRAISDAGQRLEFVELLIRAEKKRV